jgi:hypothetical protein
MPKFELYWHARMTQAALELGATAQHHFFKNPPQAAPVSSGLLKVEQGPPAALGLVGAVVAVGVAVAHVGRQDAHAAGAALKLTWDQCYDFENIFAKRIH